MATRKKPQRRTQKAEERRLAPAISRSESLATRQQFLALIRGDTDNVPLSVFGACRRLDIHPTTIRRWREIDSDFSREYGEAIDFGTDVLEDVATDRAINGVVDQVLDKDGNPVYDKDGNPVMRRITPPSDRMLEFLLVGRRPNKYGNRAGRMDEAADRLEAPQQRDIAKALALLLEEAKNA